MRDSFFGLHTKPTIRPALVPIRNWPLKLVTLYFEHANPQIPVLHKTDFMAMFEQAYATEGRVRGPKELYMLNMVFAIGGGIIMVRWPRATTRKERPRPAKTSRRNTMRVPLSTSRPVSGNSGGLEELQAVLLLANFALLRPVPTRALVSSSVTSFTSLPRSLTHSRYIIGVAVRLAVTWVCIMKTVKTSNPDSVKRRQSPSESQERERGRRQYTRDLRRRLWWCTYSFDRLVSVCVGRPFGVSDQVITTEFPCLLDDQDITPSGFARNPEDWEFPSYKIVAYHYFQLRLLQSDILQVLQYQQAQAAKANSPAQKTENMHSDLPSPFLARFDNFREWRIDIDRRLYEWMSKIPTKEATGVAFSTEFLELNYWQAIIMLYRQSLSVPAVFEGEYNTSKEVDSPPSTQASYARTKTASISR